MWDLVNWLEAAGGFVFFVVLPVGYMINKDSETKRAREVRDVAELIRKSEERTQASAQESNRIYAAKLAKMTKVERAELRRKP